jgi:uncharacterized protein (DUF2126 family)
MMRPFLLLLVLCAALGQEPNDRSRPPLFPRSKEGDVRLPNGKSQRNEIAKDDYKKNLEDATELVKLAEELKEDIAKNEAYIVSVKTLKKTEDIEKLAKNIRSRMKRL